MVKRKQKSRPAAQVKQAHRQAIETDISEAFRRARLSIGEVTTDLKELRRRTSSAVMRGRRPAKTK
jgi:hypothetical protein